VLSSAIPAEANFVADAASSFTAALARTYALCHASRRCNAENPGLARTLDRTMRRPAARPAVVRTRTGGVTRTVTITAAQVSLALFSAFYSPGGIAQIPRVITAMGRGDFGPLVGDAGGDAAAIPESDLSSGMQLSFLCQEEAAYGPASRPTPGTCRGSPVSSSGRARSWASRCCRCAPGGGCPGRTRFDDPSVAPKTGCLGGSG
jgi:hypothetical protein